MTTSNTPMTADELWTILEGLQKSATAFDLEAKAAEHHGDEASRKRFVRLRTNTRTKITKLRALIALALRDAHGGLDWPDDETRSEIVDAAQNLAEMTRIQLIAQTGLSLAAVLLDLVKNLPKE